MTSWFSFISDLRGIPLFDSSAIRSHVCGRAHCNPLNPSNAFSAVIDVEMVLPEKSNQSDVELPGDLYGEAGRGADRCDHRYSSHEGLLQKLETRAPGEQQKPVP